MDSKVAGEVKKHFRPAEGAISVTGGAKKWECIACKKIVTGSATKLKAHLMGHTGFGVAACHNVSSDAKNAIIAAEEETPSLKRKEPSSSYGLSSSSSSRQPGIAEVFKRLDKSETSYQWWAAHGGEFPELQKVAVRVSAMISGAGACERSWSAYDFVHSKKRNRLDPARAGDLVYVFTNKRLHKKAQKLEPFPDWNYGAEETEEEQEVVLA